MKREIYLWLLVIVVIVGIALYFRLFYQPVISISLGISSQTPATLYPYQKAQLRITVFNNGSSGVNNMSLGVTVNGNLTTLYKVMLPAGKQTMIAFNYSPTSAGAYAIEVVADPGKFYNIANRSAAQASYSLTVVAAENAMPSSMLPKQNILSFKSSSLNGGGYLISAYLSDRYGISRLALTSNPALDRFLEPVLNLTSYYIKNVSVAQATYNDNSSAYAIWIRGFVAPNIFSVATSGSSLSTTNVSTRAGTVTYIKLLNNTSFCSWYAGGWIKILAAYNGSGCTMFVNETANASSQVELPGLNSMFGSRFAAIKNSSSIGNYSGISGSGDYVGRLLFFRNSSFVYAGIENTTYRNSTCYGVLSLENGTSYCSTYLFSKSQQIGNLSLIRTTAYKGAYNISAFTLVNTSLALAIVPAVVGALQSLNVSGNSLLYKSGIVNSCTFNASFPCSNMSYLNGVATFSLLNNMHSAVKLNSVECYTTGGALPSMMNKTIQSGNSLSISVPCFNLTSQLGGLALGLHLNLALNYSRSNVTQVLTGSAFVPFG
jgi:hypothetical protein